MIEAELSSITPSREREVTENRKSRIVKYCFFNNKLGMTFKIHNGKVTLDGVDRMVTELSGSIKRKSSRKSGRLSVLSVVDIKTDEDREDQDEKVINSSQDQSEDVDNEDSTRPEDIDLELPPMPFTTTSKISPTKDDQQVRNAPALAPSIPIAISTTTSKDQSSPGHPMMPINSSLEYTGIAYGSSDHAGSSSLTVLSSESPSTASIQKILVESELLFGHNVKKLVKVPGSNITFQQLATAIRESCQLIQSIDQLLFTFHDPDVDDFVILDEYSIADFMQLVKKVVHLQSIAPPIPATTTNSIDTSNSTQQISEPTTPVKLKSVTPTTPTTPQSSISKVSKPTLLSSPIPTIISNAKKPAIVKIMTSALNKNSVVSLDFSKQVGNISGFVSFLVQVSMSQQYVVKRTCKKVFWKIATDLPPLGSRVLSLNDVLISDLDRMQQISLLKQRRRPFVIAFEVYETSSAAATSFKSAGLSSSTIKFNLFFAKYSSSYASKLRKQIDKILDDYQSCDWAEAKRMGTGLPQTTIISLYKYIEQEMQRLELFNVKRSRGDGAPSEMAESHWMSIRGHIEAMIFKRISIITKQTLWPIFQEAMEEVDPDEEEYQGNLFVINKKFDLPPAGHEPVLPYRVAIRNITTSGSIAGESVTCSSLVQEHPLVTNREPISTLPVKEEDESVSHMHLELSAEHGLSIKLAYLRFVTLQILGIQQDSSSSGSNKLTNEVDTSFVRQDSGEESEYIKPKIFLCSPDLFSGETILLERNQIVFQEEWYQAIRGLHQVSQLETPGEMMHRLKIVVDLITRALEKYINRPLIKSSGSSDQRSKELLNCADCGQVHIKGLEDEIVCMPTNLTAANVKEWKEIYQNIPAAIEYTDNSDAREATHNKHITGDDLLPGIVFALIQANPPNIEYLLWLCAEFRHPSLNIGEEAYCLATVSSALEFVRRASYKSVDVIPHILYDHFLLRYTYTLKLMLACKQGDLSAVKSLMEKGADVNGLSPDQVDSPLTACIRYNQPYILFYLLFEQDFARVHVNTVVHLYRGPYERCTALHVATKQGDIMMVLMLLAAGADRYIADEEDHTPLSIAMELEQEYLNQAMNGGSTLSLEDQQTVIYSSPYSVLHTILLADERHIDIVDMILRKDPLSERLLAGLILQGVDVHHLHSSKKCKDECDALHQQLHALITPLMAAVLVEDVSLVKMLLSIPFRSSFATLASASDEKLNSYFGEYYNPVNEVNSVGETALLICVEKCLVRPSEALVAIAAVLLRAGADRNHLDTSGRSAINIFETWQHQGQQSHNSGGAIQNSAADSTNPFDAGFTLAGADIPPSLQAHENPFTSGALAFFLDQYPDLCCPTQISHDHLAEDVKMAPTSSAKQQNIISMKISYASLACGFGSGDEDGFNIIPHLFTTNSSGDTSTNQILMEMQRLFQQMNISQESIFLILQSLILQDPQKSNAIPIYQASRHHDYASVRSLLLQAVDVNLSCASKGFTALIAAVYNRDVKMIQLLFKSELISKLLCPISDIWAPIFFEVTQSSAIFTSSSSSSPMSIPSLSTYTMLFPPSFSVVNSLNVELAGRGGMTPLHYAAQLGLTTVVGLLLSQNAQRERMNGQQHSAVDIAVANGHMEAANVLRFDPQKVSICLAAKHGDWLVMKALLLQGISINTVKEHTHASKGRHYELDTPLIAAVSHGQYELVKKLLSEVNTYAGVEEHESEMVIFQHQLDINQVNTIGQSALMYAAARGDENLVLLLLKNGADRYIKDAAGHDAVHWATAQNHTQIATILRHDPDLIYVHDLIRKNDYEAVVAILKQGVDVNLRRDRLLVNSSHPSIVAAVEESANTTDSSASITRSSSTSFFYHGRRLSAPTVARLEALQEFARMFIPGETPLIVAARYARMDVLQLLFKAPSVDIDAVDDTNGWSALFHAAEQGHEEVVKFLLGKKANRKIPDCLGRFARDIALLQNHEVLSAMIDADPYHVHIHDTCQHGLLMLTIGLLKQGCPPTFRDERPGMQRQTPLMAAATGGQVDIIRMLLRYPAVYDGKDDRDALGRTALMRAAAVGALDTTAILLNAGCDRNLQDQQGLTARDHAARHSFSVMFQFMSQSMVR